MLPKEVDQMFRIALSALLIGIVTGCAGAATPTPTTAPTAAPTASLLASGTFQLYGADVELHATRNGVDVSGSMSVDHGDGAFSVDLKCADTIDDGVLLLAGDIVESTSPYARKGAREVLVLKPEPSVYASFDSEGRPGGDVLPATSCPALLDQVIETGTLTVIGPNGLEPIEGTVEFGT